MTIRPVNIAFTSTYCGNSSGTLGNGTMDHAEKSGSRESPRTLKSVVSLIGARNNQEVLERLSPLTDALHRKPSIKSPPKVTQCLQNSVETLANEITKYQQNLLKKLHPKPNADVNPHGYRNNLLALEACKAVLGSKSLALSFSLKLRTEKGNCLSSEVLEFMEYVIQKIPVGRENTVDSKTRPALEIDASGLMKSGLQGEKMWNDATQGGRFKGHYAIRGVRIATEYQTTRDLINSDGLFEYWRGTELKNNLAKMNQSIKALQNLDLNQLSRLGCHWACAILKSDPPLANALQTHFTQSHIIFTNGGGAGHKVAAGVVRNYLENRDAGNLTIVQPLGIIYALWLWAASKTTWVLTDSLATQGEINRGKGNHYCQSLRHICNYITKNPGGPSVKALPDTTVHFWDHNTDLGLEHPESRHPLSIILHQFAAQTKAKTIPEKQQTVDNNNQTQTSWKFAVRPTFWEKIKTYILGIFRHSSHIGLGFRKVSRDVDVTVTALSDGRFSIATEHLHKDSRRQILWAGRCIGDAPHKMSGKVEGAETLLNKALPTIPTDEYYEAIVNEVEPQTNSKRCPPCLSDLTLDFKQAYTHEPSRIKEARIYDVQKAKGPDHELINSEILSQEKGTMVAKRNLSGVQLRGGGATISEQLAYKNRDHDFFRSLKESETQPLQDRVSAIRTVNYASMGSSPGHQQVIDYISDQIQVATAQVLESGLPIILKVVPLGFMDNKTVIPIIGLMSRSELSIAGSVDEHYVLPLCGRTQSLMVGDHRVEAFTLRISPPHGDKNCPEYTTRSLTGTNVSQESLQRIRETFSTLVGPKPASFCLPSIG